MLAHQIQCHIQFDELEGEEPGETASRQHFFILSFLFLIFFLAGVSPVSFSLFDASPRLRWGSVI
jgi:hypothetical protein